MQVTWAVVANRSGARFFERTGNKSDYLLRLSLECPEARLKNRDFTSDSPGVSLTTPGGPRHTFSPHHSSHELVADDFAKQIAKTIEQHAKSEEFNKLYLLAEPKFMGRLRQHLGGNSSKRLIDSIEKDLGSESDHDLQKLLQENCH